MSVVPVVRHLIACKKEPALSGADPSVHEILYAVRPKANLQYPVWLRPYYLFAMVADGMGVCRFHAEMRLVELDEEAIEIETLVTTSTPDSTDLGNRRLRLRFLSIQMPPALLPQRGVYRIYLICEDQEIGVETIHAR
jgi:hypothetical protein